MAFYKLITDIGKRRRFAYGISFYKYPSKEIDCNVCGRQWKKDLILDEDVSQTIIMSNSFFSDISGYEHQKLISEKVKGIFIDEQLKGYHLKDNIEIKSRDDIPLEKQKELSRKGYKVKDFATEPPIYYRFFHDGNAKLNKEKSKIRLEEECKSCSFKRYITVGKTYPDPDTPLYIIENTWDGSDFFKVEEMPEVIFCTEKVFEIYKKHNLTGLVFKEVGSV